MASKAPTKGMSLFGWIVRDVEIGSDVEIDSNEKSHRVAGLYPAGSFDLLPEAQFDRERIGRTWPRDSPNGRKVAGPSGRAAVHFTIIWPEESAPRIVSL